MIKAAVFDLDGTIIDTMDDIHHCLQHTLKHFGFKTFDKDTTEKYVGNGIKKLIERSVGIENYNEEIEKFFREYYAENIVNYSKFFENFDLVLKYLKEKIQYSFILSNKSFDLTDLIVKHFELDNVFVEWFGGDSFSERKPSPVGLFQIMEKYNLNKNEITMTGDSYTDIECGYNAGVKTCFCKYGYGNLRDIKADCDADNPIDIIKFLESF
jgi:phosphoglycolate phosphatase